MVDLITAMVRRVRWEASVELLTQAQTVWMLVVLLGVSKRHRGRGAAVENCHKTRPARVLTKVHINQLDNLSGHNPHNSMPIHQAEFVCVARFSSAAPAWLLSQRKSFPFLRFLQ